MLVHTGGNAQMLLLLKLVLVAGAAAGLVLVVVGAELAGPLGADPASPACRARRRARGEARGEAGQLQP